MGMQTDIKASSLAASGTAFNQRTRVRGALIEPSGSAGSVVFKDGGASGTTVMTINTTANGESFSVVVPADGILFQTDVYVALTNTKVTVFYG
jgi:hypothetical protein